MPTSSDSIISAILDHGSLLDFHNSRNWRRPTAERTKEMAARGEALILEIETSHLKALQSIFEFNTAGKHIDPLVLRIICLVAATQFVSASSVDANMVARAVSIDDDLSQSLRSRQTIFRLCVRGILAIEEAYYGRQELRLGKPMLGFLRGDSPEPLFVSREAVREAKRKQEIATRKRQAKGKFPNVRTARQIYDQLGQYVVGQHELRRALAVAGRQILLRRELKALGETTHLPPKSNLLVVGVSGSGKTYTCQTLSRMLDLPFASLDVSSVTASGFIGDDLSGVLYLLSEAAQAMGTNPEQGGIVYLDEADKIASCQMDSAATTTAVQFEMLRLLDGGQVSYPAHGLNKWGGSGTIMDPSGVMVICSGAFSWLADSWDGTKTSIGFRGVDSGRNRASESLRDLLVRKGRMVPELINRFPAIVRMEPLTPADIAAIHQGDHGPLSEYRATLAAEGRTISVDPEAALQIGRWSVERGLQGRGPKVAMEALLRDSLFCAVPRMS
jgi:ATP-dependent Clp protease ATP-binding subunit ClpX